MLDPSWGDLLRPFRPHWKTLLLNCVACALAGLLLAVVLPKRYTALATILPPSEEQTGMSIASLLRGIVVPGVRVPQAVTASDMVQSVLESARLRAAVAARLDPREVYGIRDSLDALEKLRSRSRFMVTPLGVIEVRVEAPRPKDAAELANDFVDELDRFLRTQRMTRGHRTRVFVESRLAGVRANVDSLLQELANYQQRHHAPALGPAATSATETGAHAYADRMNLEFQLELARSYATENSQEVKLLEARLAAMDKELDRLPPLGRETARLMRDLKAYEQAFTYLTAQYEDARIEEARDVVTLDVLDTATPPRKPSWPRKRYFAAGGLLIGVLGSLGWVMAGAPGSRSGGRAGTAP
ncbi:MAG TPA: GNVR domain-containing protein [Candidatus Saccharimonadales bacterium]|nr:GNVR domain-containing protein [Candidatus Saccharimonadales bacterium]